MAALKVVVNVDAGIGELFVVPCASHDCFASRNVDPCVSYNLTHLLFSDAGIALLAALRSPELEVIGITTSFGVASPSQAIENTLRLVSDDLAIQPHRIQLKHLL